MILRKNSWQMTFLYKKIANDFTGKMHCKWFYDNIYIINDFTIKYMGNNFTMKMHWKWFYNKNELEITLLMKSAAPLSDVAVNHLKKAKGEIWPKRNERRNNIKKTTKMRTKSPQ